ncbi:MAG TPA: VanW family protein [Alphaproteobacteria bacterium]|nr:VanW family protein [Alphaproteobacteria bacterium]
MILVAGFNLGGKTVDQAREELKQQVKIPQDVHLVSQNQTFDIATKDIDLNYDFQASAERAASYTRTGNPIYDLNTKLQLLKKPVNLGLTLNLNEEKLSKIISIIAGQNSVEPTEPSIKLVNGKIEVNKGSAGSEVDQLALRSEIGKNLALLSNENIQIPVVKIDNSLSDMGAVLVKSRAEKYLDKKLTIKQEFNNFDYQASQLLNFIDPKGGFKEEEIVKEITNIANKINRDPQNPKFSFDNNRVTEFLPALDGVKLDNQKLKNQIIEALDKFEKSDEKNLTLEAPVTKTPPEVTTDKVNNLGIKELIGRGTSTYFHSIPGRVHNVALAASRINGTLVKPGETFSFNDTLGDVSAFTGYAQAYIISGGKTILGDGGGVCQVSSTLFRALLNGGLPIVERAAHAYRVGYYEQNSPPGMDATVFGPSPDLKFTNDTQASILIVAKNDPKNYSLIFELYGTSDGRKATVTKPIVSNVRPALPTVYQDDPTLKAGVLKQVDYSAAGAKVSFDYKVEKNGATIFQKTFVSNYRPWAAVYLRGTKI